MDIKQFKPSKYSRYQQGYINPQQCTKLFESQKSKPIIFRSSWEKRFVEWCETCGDVVRWGSECLEIKYINIIDKKIHSYYPDYLIELQDGTRAVIEIKPYAQTQRPGSRASEYAKEQYLRNRSKWEYAKKFCEENGWKFWILTEKTINKL